MATIRLHLNHSKGVHTVSERHCSEISYDNGETWQKPVAGENIFGANACENSRNEIINVGCWSSKASNIHNWTIKKVDKNKKLTVRTVKVEMPYSTTVHSYRQVILTRSGKMIATAYGHKKNAAKAHLFCIISEDDGENWKFHSIIAEPEFDDNEGANESTLVELADGTILAIYRVDGWKACRQKRSVDGGKTWSKSELAVPFGASPHAILLENGTLVLVTGRPNIHLFFDFTGTGKNYQQFCIWKENTSSYGSLIEVAPNELMVIYDESSFCGNRMASPFARIMAATFKIEKDADAKVQTGDPKSNGFNFFYSAFDKKTPQELGVAVNLGYAAEGVGDAQAYVRVVPERPYPVLHIKSRGKKPNGNEWAKYDFNKLPRGVKKIEFEFELRLLDNDVDCPQFMFCPVLSPTEDKNMSAYFSFAKDYIEYTDPAFKLRQKKPFDFGFKFRTFVLKCDTDKNCWELYIKGESTPLIRQKFSEISSTKSAVLSLGDCSAALRGSVDLSYVGWKY